MEKFIDFLVNNYLWLLIVVLIIVFALIGYLVDSVNQKDKHKVKPIAKVEEAPERVHPSVEAYTNDYFDDPLINDKDIS